MFCDCHDVVASVFSTKDMCKSMRVRSSDVGKMKQILDKEEISTLTWIPTEQQLADVMMKLSALKVALVSKLSGGKFYC